MKSWSGLVQPTGSSHPDPVRYKILNPVSSYTHSRINSFNCKNLDMLLQKSKRCSSWYCDTTQVSWSLIKLSVNHIITIVRVRFDIKTTMKIKWEEVFNDWNKIFLFLRFFKLTHWHHDANYTILIKGLFNIMLQPASTARYLDLIHIWHSRIHNCMHSS
jgi:hypothetical protein